MLIRISPASEIPIFRQIIEELRSLIAKGSLAPGERLPSGRALAASLEVNMHTVLRAYQELAQAGWVEMRRGRGVRVIGPQVPTEELEQALRALVSLADQAGLDEQALLSKVSSAYRGHES